MVAPHTSPIQPSLYAVIKFHTTSYPPSCLTNSDQVPILGFGVCRTFRENGSNLNKGDSGDFCDLSTPQELCMNIRRLADRGPQTSGQRKYRQGNRRNCMNMVRVARSQEGCQCDQEITLFFLVQKTAPFLTELWRKSE